MNKLPLKPCPFCGAPAEYIEHAGDWGYTSPSVKVVCSKAVAVVNRNGYVTHRPTCFAETPTSETEAWQQGLGHYTVRYVAHIEVAELWNTRTP